ncbi:MAG: ferrous iron transport protein B, partial [Clostridia bacterium]|nr:ferrous iron transport protein B [Clostridia bacterium]
MSLKIALAGNPNSGKTTLFNALTGSNQFVGNWPGVTVEKKEGKLKGREGVIVTDLPGIYSLSPYSPEEVVARNYLVGERPDVILNIVDGTNLERNLYLTTQLIELGIPVVITINMMDIVRKNGDKLNIEELSHALGCPVVEISALKETGIDAAIEAAIAAASAEKKPPRHIFSGAVEHAVAHIEEITVHDLPEEQQRWYAVKLFERDIKVLEELALPAETLAHIEKDIVAAEQELGDDAESIAISERYDYIERVLKGCYIKKRRSGRSISEKIDRVVTNRFAALPIFALIMFLVYFISVSTVGTWVTDFTNDGLFGDGFELFGAWVPGIPVLLGNALEGWCAPWLQSLLIDGIVGGVGAVLGFVPQILVLFILLAFLEGCGYMARIAFVLDRIFRKFGLSGKSFIPMLIGTGCSVPGIMASRTIESERDRRMTVITTSFIPCGAKLPIIALIASALFSGAWWVAPSAYFVGIVA